MNKNKSFYESFRRIAFAFCAVLLGIFGVANAATLPAGYTQLEYIQSSGTQYIDTGAYITSNNLLVKTKAYSTTAGTSTEQDLFGNQDGTVGRVILGLSASNYLFLYTRYGTAAASPMVTAPFAQNQIFNIETHIENGQKWLVVDGVASETGTATNISNANKTVQLFANGNTTYFFKGRMYYFQMYDNNTLVRDMIPAQTVINGETVNGMYDTVGNQFYRSAASGTNFAAGPVVLDPCRNLFDANSTMLNLAGTSTLGNASSRYGRYLKVQPSTTYTISRTNDAYINLCETAVVPANGVALTKYTGMGTVAEMTITTAATTQYLYIYTGSEMTISASANIQVEQGASKTAYVPYCASNSGIKIATTKYNEDAFANLVTTLNSAITKVTNIVDTTVAQASSIGTLATTKQDRPADGDCPAGRKCLLVTGTDGKPHWYLIQE